MHYRFGDCQFDVDLKLLWRGGERVNLQGKSADLLLYLLNHAGRTIGRDELLENVWANIHLTDSAVGQAIMKVRKAIGDDGRSIIRTVHARGFEFTAPVSLEETSILPPSTSSPRLRLWPTLLVLALTALVVGSLLRSELKSRNEVLPTWWVGPFVDTTEDERLSWIETGLQQTVTRMLSWSGQQVVAGPDELDSSDDLASIRSFVGADYALKTHVDTQPGGFRLTVKLERRAEPVEFELSGPDLAVLTRELVKRCLDLTSSDVSPLWLQRGQFSDPLVTELHARANEALALEEFAEAAALAEAALVREPGNIELRVLLLEARTPQDGHAAAVSALKALIDESQGTLSSQQQVRLLHRLGDYLWYAGKIDSARELLDQAKVLSDQANPILQGLTLNSLSAVVQSQGDIDEAWELATLAAARFRDAGDDYHASVALSNLAYLADDWGSLDSARKLHGEALALRQKFQVPGLIAASRYGLARILRRSGDFAGADELLRLSLDHVRTADNPFDLFDNLEELAELQRARGEFSAAWDTISEAHELAEREQDALGIGWALSVRGKIRRDQRRYDDSRRWLAQAVSRLSEAGESNEAAYARLHLAETLLSAGELDEAGTILDQLPSQLAAANTGNLAIHLAHLGALRRQSEKKELLRQALSLARSSGAHDLEAFIAMDLASLALASGDSADAESHLTVSRSWNPAHHRVMDLMIRFYQLNQQPQQASALRVELADRHPEYLAAIEQNATETQIR